MGCVPIFIDVSPQTANMKTDKLEEIIIQHSIKGVMAVHVIGGSCDMDILMECVGKNDNMVTTLILPLIDLCFVLLLFRKI